MSAAERPTQQSYDRADASGSWCQLLSKLTSYLAVSDDSHAGTIHLPFDHWELLQDLRMLSQNRASHAGGSLRPWRKRVRERETSEGSLLPGALRTHTGWRTSVHLRCTVWA